jgi:dTDP-4-amino-4,6-dideoxygalactose transaminase
MTEVSAAMGLTSLESRHVFTNANRENYAAYRAGLGELPGLKLLSYDVDDTPNWHYIVVEVLENAPLSRDELLAVLLAENVLARRYFFPGCHRMEPYATLFPSAVLSQTDLVASRVLVLPTGTAIDTVAVALICDVIRRAFAVASQVRSRLRSASR